MKDKLLSLPYEDLAVIINDYELANSYQPVYTSTACNLSNLLNEGKVVSKPFILNDFAFLTVNRYNQIEPIADITKFVDFDNDLVPFVEQNKTRYACLSSLEDSKALIKDELLDPAWLEKKWAEIKKFGGRKDQKLETLASEVEAIDLRFGYKIREVENKYLNGQYSFKEALQAIKKLFEENAGPKKELSNEHTINQINFLKKKAVTQYNKLTGETLTEYRQLPDSWKKIIDPLIEGKYYKKAEQEINRLSRSEEDRLKSTRKGNKNVPSDLAYLTNLYFKCDPKDQEGFIKFAKENYIDDIQDFLLTIKKVFNDFLNNKITYDYLESYIKSINVNADNYMKYASHKETEKQKAEQEDRIQTEQNIDKEVQGHVENFKHKEKAMALFNKYYEPLRQKFLAGDYTQNQYEDLLVILIKKCEGTVKEKSYIAAIKKFETDFSSSKSLVEAIETAVEENYESYSKTLQKRIVMLVNAYQSSDKLKSLIVRAIKTFTSDEFIDLVYGLKEKSSIEDIEKRFEEKLNLNSTTSQNQTQN